VSREIEDLDRDTMTEKETRGRSRMLIPTIIMGAIALALVLLAYFRHQGELATGMKSFMGMTVEVLPLLLFAFIVAGLAQAMIPKETVAGWVGEESGFRGLLIGTMAGGFIPGGPYVSLPIAAGFLKAGAGIGTMVAFIAAWSLWGISRMPLEVGVMGWKFTGVRLACTFFFPPIAGLLAHVFFSGVK
jgi:uncharacterized membrane protein YraQ (UPF0718 family)